MDIKKIVTTGFIAILGIGMIVSLVFPRSFLQAPVSKQISQPRNDLVDPAVNQVDISDQIVVTSPLKNATINSPVTIKGKARGTWYFEGSFPIEIINVYTGLLIGKGVAQAQGEWMTEDFVPFSSTITYTSTGTTTEALLVLKKDNPSGEPANDESLMIPITVK